VSLTVTFVNPSRVTEVGVPKVNLAIVDRGVATVWGSAAPTASAVNPRHHGEAITNQGNHQRFLTEDGRGAHGPDSHPRRCAATTKAPKPTRRNGRKQAQEPPVGTLGGQQAARVVSPVRAITTRATGEPWEPGCEALARWGRRERASECAKRGAFGLEACPSRGWRFFACKACRADVRSFHAVRE